MNVTTKCSRPYSSEINEKTSYSKQKAFNIYNKLGEAISLRQPQLKKE